MQPDLDKLQWQRLGEYRIATAGSRLYLRESRGAKVAGFVFAVVLGGATGWLGVSTLFTDTTVGGRAFAMLMLLIAALFAFVLVWSLWPGHQVMVYDRGGPGVPGEIRLGAMRLPAERVRALSTRVVGGTLSTPRRVVVAELHDGGLEMLGLSSISTWTDHYGRHLASWMGLPFRHTTE